MIKLNGETQELLNELDKRLAINVSLQKEKWSNHDKNANNRHNDYIVRLDKIDKKIDKLPCDRRAHLKEKIEILYWVNGIIIIGGIIFGIWIKAVMA